ncbi:UDP-sugar pyrophosphorylase [Trypanosoma theileri]|uniref:UDP-N-acetylglucosamine diphosphorylase n=1 Tax=Trypanosoma theileri TaxID=67003 RepID=A0A1X0P444_9TRYP|nr:UDP-sugar pyrophosphorylase [Trypanosoma theileri]ORC91598.1 UDP-sugar pyrophosphorylase [Trypanosoma theileri]
MGAIEEVKSSLAKAGQEHILNVLEHGTAADQATLSQQLSTELSNVDFCHLNSILQHSLEHKITGGAALVEPPSKDFLFDVEAERHHHNDRILHLETLGYNAIHAGQVAFLILAGGSGTRLGADVPKGLFTCNGLRLKKPLFQLHCERLRKREELAAVHCGGVPSGRIQLLVMTSSQNDRQTREFFQENNFFGLVKEQVHFFQQFSLPCYDEKTGKILMESSGRMCISPGGNGGVYTALSTPPNGEKISLLQRLEELGVKYIQIGNVDNLLSKMADPLFIGYAVEEKAHVVVKSSPKVSAEESVGVYARMEGEWGVVEYTEIGKRAAEVDAKTGELKFNCANISCYLCSLRFLQVAAEKMKTFTQYHAAHKKISTINGPVMGVKLEAFIFDLFRFVKYCYIPPKTGDDGFRIMQVNRNEEFAPIKNADGHQVIHQWKQHDF